MIEPLKRKKRQTPRLPNLPMKARSSKSRKLSEAQRNLVLDLLAQGRRPAEIRDLLRREQGVEVTSACISGYVKHHQGEIVQRKKRLAEGMDMVHLRHRLPRLQELVRLHALLIRRLFREMCPDCLGQGVMGADNGVVGRCRKCKGQRWVIAAKSKAYDLGDDYGVTALTLANCGPPNGADIDLATWDRLIVVLREIADVVGDSKIRIAVDSEEQERLARAQERQAWAKQVAAMSAGEFRNLLETLAGERGQIIEVGLAGTAEVGADGG